ncbi:trypsin-like peptidase domain-containing protein [Rubritepida flocculans]|uniref:trypsin-like peptidase domain-containing protein n=1 Tax=Rubritepida flocculans TaxID=182403 RepID=UPI0004143870|nr:trypsin-like peptidase domain-containing protein [Rubritepida flocculans]
MPRFGLAALALAGALVAAPLVPQPAARAEGLPPGLRAALDHSPCFQRPTRPAALRGEAAALLGRSDGPSLYRLAEAHMALPGGVDRMHVAESYLARAVAAGMTGAALELGAIRFAVHRDAAGAFATWLHAASLGDPRSMACVAAALLTGQGAAVDRAEAMRWLTLRDEATRGRAVLGPVTAEVARALTPREVDEGRLRARQPPLPVAPPGSALPGIVLTREAAAPPPWLSGVAAPPRPPAPPPESQATSTTGFVIAPGGLVMTAEHGVSACAEIEVVAGLARLGGARLVARNEDLDIALLAVPGLERRALPVAAQLRLGEEVVAIGFPGRGVASDRPTATLGNVSAEGAGRAAHVLQYTAPTQPGKSGGPLLDRRGQVVGMVFAVRDTRREQLAGLLPSQNVNFAVAGPTLHRFLLDHAITPAQAPATGAAMDAAQIVDQVERSVVQIICHAPRAGVTPARAAR